MGLGIVDPEGGSPCNKWRLRISYAEPKVRHATQELLAGGTVLSRDDEVQISWTSDGDSRGLIRIRDAKPGTDYLLKVVVGALGQDEIRRLSSPDPAGIARPLPAAWMTVLGDTLQIWELFNCRVESVKFGSA